MPAIFTTYGQSAYNTAVANNTTIEIGKMVISNNTAAVTASMTELTNIYETYERLNMVIGLNGKDFSLTAMIDLPPTGGNKQIGVFDTSNRLIFVERINVPANTSTLRQSIIGVAVTGLDKPEVFTSRLFSPISYASVKDTLRVIQELNIYVDTVVPRGADGMVYRWENELSPRSDWLMRHAAVVDSDAAMSQARNSIVSMEEIFNTWYRFSHSKNNYVYPANSTEVNGWALNASKELYTTVNSGSYIGFISPTKHIDFELDVQIRSTSGDDDAAAIVIAFESSGGVEHNISVVRCLGGFPAWTWRMYYNYNQSNETLLANMDHTVMWGDGVHGSNRASTPYVQNGGWNRANIASGVRIRVTRNGDIITAQTSDFGSSALVPASLITINLANNAILAPLRVPASYGYGSFSQPNTFFNTTTMLDKNNVIADIRTGKVYAYNGTAWVDTGQSFLEALGPNSILYSKISKRAYHVLENGNVVRII